MAGIADLLGLGRGAIQAQAYALNVTGQNITNASTPGYVRRTAILETQANGAATYGGVVAKGLERSVDQFLDARTLEASGFKTQAKARDDALARVESLFNDTSGSGLASSLNALFSSFSALGTTPTDSTARTTVLESARSLATRINQTSQQIGSLRQDLVDQAQGVVTEINSLSAQLVTLNRQVATAQAAGSDAADLRDQRDRIVGQISQRINVHVFTGADGQFAVAAGGAVMAEGEAAANLTISLSPSGALQVLAQRKNGAVVDITNQVTGGTLGGIREARDVDTVEVGERLDQFAYDLANAANEQHRAGYGLDGQTGRNLFREFESSDPTGAAASIALDPSIDGNPEQVAAADSTTALPGGAGNAVRLSELATRPISGSGTRTAVEAYSDLVADVGQRKATSAQNAELRDSILSQVKTLRDAVSSVSLDEEMVSLSLFQRAYQAGAKLITTADELLAGLMQSL